MAPALVRLPSMVFSASLGMPSVLQAASGIRVQHAAATQRIAINPNNHKLVWVEYTKKFYNARARGGSMRTAFVRSRCR